MRTIAYDVIGDFQYCEMDTDSAYIAIAGPSVDSLVKSELREEFEADKANWFPRTDTPEHKAYDKRTPHDCHKIKIAHDVIDKPVKLDILNEIPPQVNEIPAHFIHEIKTIAYDVSDVNLFPPTLMRFPPKKEA